MEELSRKSREFDDVMTRNVQLKAQIEHILKISHYLCECRNGKHNGSREMKQTKQFPNVYSQEMALNSLGNTPKLITDGSFPKIPTWIGFSVMDIPRRQCIYLTGIRLRLNADNLEPNVKVRVGRHRKGENLSWYDPIDAKLTDDYIDISAHRVKLEDQLKWYYQVDLSLEYKKGIEHQWVLYGEPLNISIGGQYDAGGIMVLQTAYGYSPDKYRMAFENTIISHLLFTVEWVQ